MKTLLLYLFVFLILLNHQSIILENQQILLFFIEQLLPSLFLLCVLVQILPFSQTSSFDSFFYKLFHFNTSTFFIIIKTIFLGNPAGSYMILSLNHEKKLNNEQVQRLINCCAIPSISFMLMSLAYITTIRIAYTIFFIHIISIFIMLFFTRKTTISLKIVQTSSSLSKAIIFSLQTMAFILSYLLIIVSIKTIMILYFPQFKNLIHLFMEFSSGTLYFAHHEHVYEFLLICIGFGGFCSHLQIMDRCQQCELTYHRYLFYRILHVLLNLTIYFTIYFLNIFI